jgi:hypothetical protein
MLLAGGLAATLPFAASAQIVKELGKGWEVTIFQPNMVDVFVDPSGPGTLVIEKIAEFTEIDPFTGAPEPVLLTFRQNQPDAMTVDQIVITSAVITNSTGQDWISFTEALLPGTLAQFNQGLSSNYSIDPFTARQYSQGDSQVEFSGGTVGAGQTWSPGVAQGGLVIDVDLSGAAPVVFTLKELPGIPAPGAIALLTLGGLVAARRRR